MCPEILVLDYFAFTDPFCEPDDDGFIPWGLAKSGETSEENCPADQIGKCFAYFNFLVLLYF